MSNALNQGLQAAHQTELQKEAALKQRQRNEAAAVRFRQLIQEPQYVGEVFSINYETALVQIHDNHRMRVGGIPSLSFLIATRVSPANLNALKNPFQLSAATPSTAQPSTTQPATNGAATSPATPATPIPLTDDLYKLEDASVILLRVLDGAPLPDEAEALRVRTKTAQNVSGEPTHWDDASVMDGATAQILSYAGMKCRIIGTFFLEPQSDTSETLVWKFGSDLSNYYPNRGLKVYKPNADALKTIVNYRDPMRDAELQHLPEVEVGAIRYASTNRSFQGVSDVPIFISPADLKAQKTAVFGMTRTGKSNTTKIIAQSIYELRFASQQPQRIGQLIFDLNGEYANENAQDNHNALKNIWQSHGAAHQADVVTYGILSHPNDPHRVSMLLNFYVEDNLQIGKEIINDSLSEDAAKYINNFRQVSFAPPDQNDHSATTRYNRRVLAYRALLHKAGFVVTQNLRPSTRGLFKDELFDGRPTARNVAERFNGMRAVTSDPENADRYRNAADVFNQANPSWDAMSTAFEALRDFLNTTEYKDGFNRWYVNDRQGASGENWADEDFKKILEMFSQPNGARQIGQVRNLHTHATNTDYAEDIYNHLVAGRVVIIDQSSGEQLVNESSARRTVGRIFDRSKELFRRNSTLPEILIYVEEAHNLLPAGTDTDTSGVWVRIAKEGAKYRIGLVYATQEVSSIQKNILKNTSNWFIGHLNNTDETRELCKYYDFADFEKSILRAQDKGFLRIKTLSNPFVIPAQIKKFELPPLQR